MIHWKTQFYMTIMPHTYLRWMSTRGTPKTSINCTKAKIITCICIWNTFGVEIRLGHLQYTRIDDLFLRCHREINSIDAITYERHGDCFIFLYKLFYTYLNDFSFFFLYMFWTFVRYLRIKQEKKVWLTQKKIEIVLEFFLPIIFFFTLSFLNFFFLERPRFLESEDHATLHK